MAGMLKTKLVGEPSGSNPLGFQDMEGFDLPNSGRRVNDSKRLYRFSDEASAGLQPDVFVPLRWLDLKRGTDAVLDWVLQDIARRR